MKRPFFSVIIPTYNRKDFLKIAIDSVLYQNFLNFELIIIDDGSSDQTKLMVKHLRDERIRYIDQTHRGVAAARNRGIREACGNFICFLDSDDRFRQRKLEITHECIKKYPQYKIFHTEEIWYRNGTLLAPKIYHKKPTGWVFKDALKICCVSISTAAIKKDVFAQIGGFDENLRACEDYDFWLRVTLRFPVLLISQYLTIKEGGHPDQQSKKFVALDKLRIYALEKILSSKDLKKKDWQLAFAELKNKCSIYIKGAEKRAKTNEVKYYQNLIANFEKEALYA